MRGGQGGQCFGPSPPREAQGKGLTPCSQKRSEADTITLFPGRLGSLEKLTDLSQDTVVSLEARTNPGLSPALKQWLELCLSFRWDNYEGRARATLVCKALPASLPAPVCIYVQKRQVSQDGVVMPLLPQCSCPMFCA